MTGQETGLATPGNRWQRWSAAAMNWRDWRVPAKLIAVTAVPAVFVVALGIVQIQSQVEQANRYASADRQVAVNEQVRAVLTALQEERDGAAEFIADGRVADPAQLRQQGANSDAAHDAVTTAVAKTIDIDSAATAVAGPMQHELGRLPGLRDEVLGGRLDAGAAVTQYTEVIGSVLNFERALISGFDDATLSTTATALYDLSAGEEEIYFQQSLVLAGIGRGTLAPQEQQRLRESEVRLVARMNDFRVVADPADQRNYDRIVTGPLIDQRSRLEQAAVNAPAGPAGGTSFPVAQHSWTVASDATTFDTRQVSDGLTAKLRTIATTLQNRASSSAGFNAVVLVCALLIAGAVGFVVARQLVRSLRLLRHSALDVAADQLPTAVRNIRRGDSSEISVEPVPVYSKEEVGEVARAFDEVHLQALRLAGEQTALRRSYNNVFVNLSRRSQGLVERQLTLFERLERDEEDPAQLSTLFQLDHLATRMRRNNENLMVLSGGELARRFSQPVPLTDLLRAAISEIEHYPRVLLRTTTSARVLGHAASDVLRLLAELMDNAANFSPPKNKVTVATYPNPAGAVTVDILDRGIGMTEEEADRANERLTAAQELDISASRRMGLFVVGRLANRHGIIVRLFASQSLEGVRAAITLPAELIVTEGARTAGGSSLAATASGPQDTETPAGPAGGVEPRKPALFAEQRNAAEQPPVEEVAAPEDSPAVETAAAASDTSLQSAESETGRDDHDARARIVSELFNLGAVADVGAGTQRNDAPELAAFADEVHVSPPWTVQDVPAASRAGSTPPITDLFSATGEPAAPSGTQAGWADVSGAAGAPAGANASDGRDADRRISETTPIFDELASAWFRESLAETDQRAGGARTESAADANEVDGAVAMAADSDAGEWRSAADEGWRAVDEVAQPGRVELTSAGLPKRVRGSRLLPGSVVPTAPSASGTERDPAALRGRLSSFQRGLREARHAAAELVSGESVSASSHDSAPETPSAATHPDAASTETMPAIVERAATERPDPTSDADEGDSPSGVAAETADPSVAGDLDATAGADSTSSADPAGGSDPTASEDGQATETAQAADADAAEPGEVFAWESAADPDRPAPPAMPTAEPAAPAESVSWSHGLQRPETAVEQDLTSAGLPRRVPRARLRPGSVAATDAANEAPERDAEMLRGRLSSFQRGVQRGRRARGSAASTVLERRQEKA